MSKEANRFNAEMRNDFYAASRIAISSSFGIALEDEGNESSFSSKKSSGPISVDVEGPASDAESGKVSFGENDQT